MLVFAIHIGRHVNDFFVPESDFFDFRDKAVSLRQLDWPDNFKRPPLYSTAIAVVSSFIPGQHRELYAAEAIGFIAALAALFFMFRIAQSFCQRGALFVAWLWAFHPSTIRMAIKPKSEMLVTMLILWAFYLFMKNRRSAYLLGFFASLVRYEGALIIAAIGIADFFMHKEKIKTIFYSLLAGMPIVLWTLLQSSGGDGESYFSYFNDYKPNVAFLKTFWQGLVGFMPPSLSKLWILIAVLIFTIGVMYGWMKYRRPIIALLVFLCGFLAMHIVWPMPNFDYQIIVSWNALLIMGLGAAVIFAVAREKIKIDLFDKPFIAPVTFILFIAVLVFLVLKPVAFPQYLVDWRMMLLFFSPVAVSLLFILTPTKTKTAAGFSAMTLFLVLLYFMSSDTNALLYSIRYSKAEFAQVGEWLKTNETEVSKVAVEQPVIVSYYAEKEMSDFVRLTELKKTTPDSLHAWLRDNGISHIAWMSANKIFETDNAWYEWKMDNRGWKTIDFLSHGQSVNGFTLVKEIKIGLRWAYIYKIQVTPAQAGVHNGIDRFPPARE